MSLKKITSPDDASFDELTRRLAEMAPELDASQGDPTPQLRLCAEAGLFEWFLPQDWGGQGWSGEDLVRAYLKLSAACLTTTFIITQRTGACRRIAAAGNDFFRSRFQSVLASGDCFATLGISHLTTSRRHLARPVMRAEETTTGIRLDGFSPWVTGAPLADLVLTGATLDDGRQVLAVLPTDLPGVSVPRHAELVALTASQTGPLNCARVDLDQDWIIAGPMPDVMKQGVGAKSGGLQTTTLAVGLAQAALEFLQGEVGQRSDLAPPTQSFAQEFHQLRDHLLATVQDPDRCSAEELRTRANSLVIRITQAALAAAKGSGYVQGHPAGRWCREALFFLVWSCPQPVMSANLCELAGISD